MCRACVGRDTCAVTKLRRARDARYERGRPRVLGTVRRTTWRASCGAGQRRAWRVGPHAPRRSLARARVDRARLRGPGRGTQECKPAAKRSGNSVGGGGRGCTTVVGGYGGGIVRETDGGGTRGIRGGWNEADRSRRRSYRSMRTPVDRSSRNERRGTQRMRGGYSVGGPQCPWRPSREHRVRISARHTDRRRCRRRRRQNPEPYGRIGFHEAPLARRR